MYAFKQKTELREEILQRRRGLSDAHVQKISRIVCSKLLRLQECFKAQVIALYAAVQGEIKLDPVISESKRRKKENWLPRYNAAEEGYEMVPIRSLREDTQRGRYGILEPLSSYPPVSENERVDPKVLWCVPGVAFDHYGTRLGFGGGFYDKLLHSVNGCKVGIAHDWQILKNLPKEEQDIPMDIVLSEERLLRV